MRPGGSTSRSSPGKRSTRVGFNQGDVYTTKTLKPRVTFLRRSCVPCVILLR
jgi:hypothetical protein